MTQPGGWAKPRRRAVVHALLGLVLLGGVWLQPWAADAQGPEPAKGVKFPAISQTDLKTWLTYLSSDELEGRQVFSEGYGLAAGYVAERLHDWGVVPLGDDGTYFQIVKVRSYRVVRHSWVKVDVRGVSRTFVNGDHVTFPARAGGSQTVVASGADLLGVSQFSRLGGAGVKDKLVLSFGDVNRRGDWASAPTNPAIAQGARATIAYVPAPPAPGPADGALAHAQDALASAVAAVAEAKVLVAAEHGRGLVMPARRALKERDPLEGLAVDIPPTSERMENLVPPQVTADNTFFDWLLSGTTTTLANLKTKAASGTPVGPIDLSAVTVTFHVENEYQPASTQLTHNVVGLVRGTDPALNQTYVLFGAHLDHVGYAETDHDARGSVNVPIATDRIWNGADDDGTGTTAELALAKAFATGPKPRRSVVFVWHAGEEAGLYGSKYNADFPVVPLDRVQCQLNMDMIGRNRDDDTAEGNTVFVIGADRISTDLHNLIVDTNAKLARPLTLDFQYNDPNDPESFYTRSDHYSYASKGIPIAFFFTGTHPDYHANTDSVNKILFNKQAHIAQLVYETGFAVANSSRPLERDNLGPRAGRGFVGRIER